MANKEAIFYLKQVREDYEGKEFVEGKEALDLAIKALEQIDLIKFNIYALNKLIEEADNETKKEISRPTSYSHL